MSTQNLKIISSIDLIPAYLLKNNLVAKNISMGEMMCLIRLEFSALGNHSIEAGLALSITQYFEVGS